MLQSTRCKQNTTHKRIKLSNRQKQFREASSGCSISRAMDSGNLQSCSGIQLKRENSKSSCDIYQMNLIQSIQRKYLPGFYESRYAQRKKLALAVKDKCLKNPKELSIYELKVVLKVLQQFNLLDKQPQLQQMQKQLKMKIAENSVWSTVGALLPYAVRQFHRIKFVRKVATGAVLFCGINYFLMSKHFQAYISECRKIAQKNINKLVQSSKLPLQ